MNPIGYQGHILSVFPVLSAKGMVFNQPGVDLLVLISSYKQSVVFHLWITLSSMPSVTSLCVYPCVARLAQRDEVAPVMCSTFRQRNLVVFLTEPSFRQLRTTGMVARVLCFPWHHCASSFSGIRKALTVVFHHEGLSLSASLSYLLII